jgi:transcriptional regulator with XRE-family HTH domain
MILQARQVPVIKTLIGKKLKATRLGNGFTIQELTNLSGVSANMISRIERGLTVPSVKILMKLASALGMSIGYFVEEAEKSSTAIFTKKGQGEPIFFYKDKHQISSLTQGLRDPSFTVLHDVLEAGCNSGGGHMVHTGEEFVMVLDGRLEFTIQNDRYILESGDSLSFKASLPHHWCTLENGPTEVLWVVSPAPNISQ